MTNLNSTVQSIASTHLFLLSFLLDLYRRLRAPRGKSGKRSDRKVPNARGNEFIWIQTIQSYGIRLFYYWKHVQPLLVINISSFVPVSSSLIVHCSGPNVGRIESRVENRASLQYVALEDITAGTELCICYVDPALDIIKRYFLILITKYLCFFLLQKGTT